MGNPGCGRLHSERRRTRRRWSLHAVRARMEMHRKRRRVGERSPVDAFGAARKARKRSGQILCLGVRQVEASELRRFAHHLERDHLRAWLHLRPKDAGQEGARQASCPRGRRGTRDGLASCLLSPPVEHNSDRRRPSSARDGDEKPRAIRRRFGTRTGGRCRVFAHDPDRLARFEREAQVLASP